MRGDPGRIDTYIGVMADFLTDVTTLRERARAEIEKGPITEAYGADRERVIQVLNEALATEIVCWLRYLGHAFVRTTVLRMPFGVAVGLRTGRSAATVRLGRS